MEKKQYISPAVKCVNLLAERSLAAGSDNTKTFGKSWNSREATDWDDEEEEENTGGWFK